LAFALRASTGQGEAMITAQKGGRPVQLIVYLVTSLISAKVSERDAVLSALDWHGQREFSPRQCEWLRDIAERHDVQA